MAHTCNYPAECCAESCDCVKAGVIEKGQHVIIIADTTCAEADPLTLAQAYADAYPDRAVDSEPCVCDTDFTCLAPDLHLDHERCGDCGGATHGRDGCGG